MAERPILFSGPMVRAILEGRKSQTRRALKPQPPSGEWDVGTLAADMIFPTVVDRHGEEQLGRECFGATCESGEWCLPCPYGQTGDQLWVRETMTYWERPSQTHDDSTPRSNESHRPADGKRYQRWMNRVMARELDGEDFLVYRADDSMRSLGEWKFPHPIYEHCVGRFGKIVPSIFMPRWASRLTLRITKVRVERLQEISESDAIAEGIEPVTGSYFRVYEKGYESEATTAIPSYRSLWESINGKGSWDASPWVWVIEFERIQQQEKAA